MVEPFVEWVSGLSLSLMVKSDLSSKGKSKEEIIVKGGLNRFSKMAFHSTLSSELKRG
ncbi:MAG: hypothetical protein ABIK18_01250 [candidate division WOR-3 bacterium]